MQVLSRAALIAALCSLSLSAGSNLRGGGKDLFWKDGKVKLRVSRTVHRDSGSSGVDRRETAVQLHAAIFEAILSWVRPGRAKLELDLDFTDSTSVSAGENIVTFTDPAPFDTGLCDKERFIACTLLSFDEDGAIASASVAFNPYKRHSSLGFDGTHDLGLIMMHEMGHVLGLNHSFVSGSVMLTEAEQDPAPGAPRLFAVRRLAEDDLSALAGLYPLESPPPSISGLVKRGADPVAGARVTAIDAFGRVPCGVLSGEDGSYRLLVPPGDYTIVAEPSDGAAATAVDGRVVLASGESREGIEVRLSPATGAAAKLIVTSLGVVAGGLYAGLPRVDLARGRDHSFALTRSPIGLPIELQFPELVMQGSGPATSPSSAPQLVRQTIKVRAEAAPGSYTLVARAGELIALLPASLRVVTNPRLDTVLDAETGQPVTVLRTGRRYLLKGADFSAVETTAQLPFDGAPPPTQLESVALRFGDRFLPIVSIKPAELLFELPAGVAAEGRLVLVAGSFMESNPLAVTIEP